MNLERYKLIVSQEQGQYEFLSEGPKGVIRKVIHYLPIGNSIYNLGFGDWDEVNQKINDKSRSNNGDREKILVTVADSVMHFIQLHPHAIVFSRGETPSKTRLYQMAIAREWKTISKLYKIKGFYLGKWEEFTPAKNYDAFTLEILQ
ncbi:MAG TPA: hypothetical protein VHN59_07960 [Chitinophagaceae bacterium]|nr:hypothetical protein [Chitinophagaceae bacterium]